MIEEAKDSKNWVGARQGAGRKSMNESETREKLRAAAKAAGISASELVTRWAETL